MNDVQQALLIKNAYKHPHETKNTTALVTANGHVTIAHVDNLNTLFQFTLEQWQEIVDFVSIATWDELRDKPEAEKDWVDWSKVSKGYDWVAMDSDNAIFEYTGEEPEIDPSINENAWIMSGEDGSGHWNRNTLLVAPENLDWRKSLRKRPETRL